MRKCLGVVRGLGTSGTLAVARKAADLVDNFLWILAGRSRQRGGIDVFSVTWENLRLLHLVRKLVSVQK